MKNIVIVECRKCGTQYNGDNRSINIGPNEQIDVIIRKISKCSGCMTQ